MRDVNVLIAQVVAAKPERQRAIERLLGPLVRQRSFTAPDKVFALGTLADWAGRHADAVLDSALENLLLTRKATVKPSDVENEVKAAFARKKLRGEVEVMNAVAAAKVKIEDCELRRFEAGTAEFTAELSHWQAVDPGYAAIVRKRGCVQLAIGPYGDAMVSRAVA